MRVVFAGVVAATGIGAQAQDWESMATEAEVVVPEPLEALQWRTDLRGAIREAGASGRPVFVTFRCLPCHQCAEFDASVLDGGGVLDQLLRQFITVRLTDARQLDLAILPAEGFQDFDLSWWGYFLSPEGRVYGVFGGKDHVSDSTRISEAALANTMRRVLRHHYDERRPGWDVDGPAPDLSASAGRPSDLPGYEDWARGASIELMTDCLHCHQVSEVIRQPAVSAGTFDWERDLAVWPLPENVGMEIDRDDGLLVTSVGPESAAARAGVRAGDQLFGAGDRRVFGQADLRGVLHRGANPAGEIVLRWIRDGELMTGELALEDGWRDTVLWWRMSVSQGNLGAAPGFAWPNRGPRRGVPAGSMSISPWFGRDAGQWPAFKAGLRPGHVIIAVDGESPDLAGREFMTWFRRHHNPGDEVVLSVLEGDARREIRYELP